MRRHHFFATIVGALLSVFLTDTASAYYHPGMGRFMHRDSIGTNVHAHSVGVNAVATSNAFIPTDSIAAPGTAVQNDFVPRDAHISSLEREAIETAVESRRPLVGDSAANMPHLWQYADGMNLYQYVQNNPVIHRDPSGMLTLQACLRACSSSQKMARFCRKIPHPATRAACWGVYLLCGEPCRNFCRWYF